MTIEKSESERGFPLVRIPAMPGYDKVVQVRASSIVLDNLSGPGSSALWIGNDDRAHHAHLDRERVGELIQVLQHWHDTGQSTVG